MIIDTNIVLYEIRGLLAEALPRHDVGISIVTKIELLGYPKLGTAEQALINTVLKQVKIWPVDDQVADIAIMLRQRQALKVPDAVIAATAVVLNQELWTNDFDLSRIEGLRCRSVNLRPSTS